MGVTVLRTVVLYSCIVLALRIMGKRQVGELEPAELVITILVSNIATLSIEDTNIPLLGSILPIFTLVCCEVLASVLMLKSRAARRFISGNPCILIRDGILDQKEMRALRWSIDDVTEQLRAQGIFDIRDVSFAVVETAGTLSAYQKYAARPVTAQAMNLSPAGEPDSPPMTVICDGKLDRDALHYLGLDEAWVQSVLRQHGLAVRDIFIMTGDRLGKYDIQRKERRKNAKA